MKQLLFLSLVLVGYAACSGNNTDEKAGNSYDHALNIPTEGIKAKLGSNNQKIIEGDKESVIIAVGDVNKKEADVSIRLGDRLLAEKLLSEKQTIRFSYFDHPYTLSVDEIKKPLIGSGKVSISIQ